LMLNIGIIMGIMQKFKKRNFEGFYY
jgi:hypothetical protein